MANKNLPSLILLVLLMSFKSFGQSQLQIDSLERVAKTAKDTSKVKALAQLSNAYLYSDPTKALSYGQKALALSKELHFDKGIANSMNVIGNYYFQTADYQQALNYQKSALAIKINLKDYVGMAKSYVNLANAFYGLSNYKEAIKNYYLGLKYSEQTKNINLTTMAYSNLANVFYDLKNYPEAIKINLKTIEIREKIKDDNGLAFSYNNLGIIYRDINEYEKALFYLNKGLNAAQITANKTMISYSLSNIGDVNYRQGKLDLALAAQQKSLAIQTELGEKMGMMGSINTIASIYLKQLNLIDAENYYAKTLAYGKELKNFKILIEANAGLAKVAEARNDFKGALKFNQQEGIFKDSLFREDNSKQISELEKKYQTEKKQQQIALLSKENTIQKLSISKKNTTIYSIITLLIALAVFSALFYNRYKLKNETRLQGEIIKQQDLATKAVLTAEENERRRIASDLHDGVGQLFSTVKMNLSGIENQIDFKDESSKSNFQKTIALVDESCKEVRSISHQMAPNVLIKSGLVSAVRDFITKVDERKLKINMEVQGLNERIDSNVEMVLYRVIQETVNNVIKHAKADRLDIQIIKDLEGLSVMIEDNGIGFDVKNNTKEDGLGLKNIISRITYLKGTVDFDSSMGNGTVVSIFIPNS